MPWTELDIPSDDSAAFSPTFRKKGRLLVDENLGVDAAEFIRAQGWNAKSRV